MAKKTIYKEDNTKNNRVILGDPMGSLDDFFSHVIVFMVIFLLFSLVSAETVSYKKCFKESFVEKKAEKAILTTILRIFMPLGWVSWITGYATYEEEVECVLDKTFEGLNTTLRGGVVR